ncbi:hypothetical protein PVA38_11290 [Streptococcus pneumoniae D39]|nr:hypothetical protein PVA38_11290 [Streptococcus pneumoniae D39]
MNKTAPYPINQLGSKDCLLYTSDAADEARSVDLGGRRIIKKKKQVNHTTIPFIFVPAQMRLYHHSNHIHTVSTPRRLTRFKYVRESTTNYAHVLVFLVLLLYP